MAALPGPHHTETRAEFAAVLGELCPLVETGQVLRERTLSVRGTVAGPTRQHSSNLGFALLTPADCEHDDCRGAPEGGAEGLSIQLVMNSRYCEQLGGLAAYQQAWRAMGAGDLVQATGHPGKTRTGRAGELSLFATTLRVVWVSPDCDRALGLLLDHAGTAAAAESVPQQQLALAAEARSEEPMAAAEQAEVETCRLLRSMLDDSVHGTAAVLGLLRQLAAPLLERRRQEIALAAHGDAAASAASAAAGRSAPLLGWEQAEGELGGGPTDTVGAPAPPCAAGRLARLRAVAARRQKGLVVVLEELAQPSNVGAVLRTCDAFGVIEVCHIGAAAEEGRVGGAIATLPAAGVVRGDDPVVRSVSKGASDWVCHRYFGSSEACLRWLAEERGGCPSVATAPPPQGREAAEAAAGPAVDGEEEVEEEEEGGEELPWGGSRLAVWFGNERRGLSGVALQACQRRRRPGEEGGIGCHADGGGGAAGAGVISIPMRGMVESLNIAATVAAVLAEVTRQRDARRAAHESVAARAGATVGGGGAASSHGGGGEGAAAAAAAYRLGAEEQQELVQSWLVPLGCR